jgi:capsular exopolysaccharide synthesis family protein
VSRIFEALRRAEKANGNKAPSSPADNGGQWNDLMASLESWSANDACAIGSVPPSAARADAPVMSKSGISATPGQVDNTQSSKTSRQPFERREQWRDLATQINSLPEIIEQAEGVVSQPQAEERVLTAGQFHVSAQEIFRVLCQRLLQVREQRSLRTVLVTSAIPREGKTVVAINLAAMLARNSSAVLLVDADLRHPRLPFLGIAPGPGLADYLAGRVELKKAIRRVDPLGFYYLAAGAASSNPAELFQKPALEQFIRQAAASFEWVILDSPSVNLFADPRYLAMLVDGVLVVVREDLTPKEAAEKCLVALEKAFVVGLVLNASSGSSHADYDRSQRLHRSEKEERAAAKKPAEEKSMS